MTDSIGGRCSFGTMDWYCVLAAGHDGPHESDILSPPTPSRLPPMASEPKPRCRNCGLLYASHSPRDRCGPRTCPTDRVSAWEPAAPACPIPPLIAESAMHPAIPPASPVTSVPARYDSGTYGELPPEIRPLIQGYEWDNMPRDEQRAWLIAQLRSALLRSEAESSEDTKACEERLWQEMAKAGFDLKDDPDSRHVSDLILTTRARLIALSHAARSASSETDPANSANSAARSPLEGP